MKNNNKFTPVFVLSSGRSGSTLLQRYLNCSKDLILWGEHGGFIRGLSESYYRFINLQYAQDVLNWGGRNAELLLNKGSLKNQDIEWTNNFTLEDWRTAHQELILRLLTISVPSSFRWGFKEIRYGEREMRFLKELFPESHFIFLVRDPIDALASMIAAWFQPENFWERSDWANSDVLSKVQDFISRHCKRTIRVSHGIIKYMNDAYLVKFRDLKEHPYTILPAICDYLNIKVPSVESITSVSSDVRKATKSKAVKKIIYDNFLNNDDVRELCKVYEAFGYTSELGQS
jgi:hypothetical protein